MALTASNFIEEPAIGMDKTKGNVNGAIIDQTVQGVFNTEPIFEVNNVKVRGFQNFKMYDQYSGHVINAEGENALPTGVSDESEVYEIETNGKQYISGKTYYLGYKVLAVPTYTQS